MPVLVSSIARFHLGSTIAQAAAIKHGIYLFHALGELTSSSSRTKEEMGNMHVMS